MFTVGVTDSEVVVTFEGMGRLLAMRKRVSAPISSISDARTAPDAAGWIAGNIQVKKSWKGSYVHGRYAMGSLSKAGERSFWAIRTGDGAVEVTLSGHDFDRLVVEPDDPNGFLSELRERLGHDL
jgi:hypothetical protein